MEKTLIGVLIGALFIGYLFFNFINSFILDNQTKIFLIGIDGAEWDVINTLITEEELPTIEKLIKEGSYGTHESIEGMCSPIIWTSIATGKVKEKHGIFGFEKNSSKGTVESIVTSECVKSKRIWDILSEYGKTVGVYHWLVTWPPKEVNGFMFSAWLSQNETKAYPARLNSFDQTELFTPEFSSETVFQLLEEYDPDFFASVYYQVDWKQHALWKYWEPEKFGITNKEEVERRRHEIIGVYKYTDELIEKIYQKYGNKSTIFIVSDHGFMASEEGIKYDFYFNSLLQELNLLSYSGQRLRISIHPGSKVYQCKLSRFELAYLLPNTIQNVKFCILDEKYKDDIIKKLHEVKYRDTNESFFINIQTIDNRTIGLIFNISSPNFKFKIDELHPSISLTLPNNKKFELKLIERSGVHGPHGIIIAKGPMIKANYEIKNMTVYDITPTILYLYGLPVPRDMDGRILTEIIREEYLIRHPINYTNVTSQKQKTDTNVGINTTWSKEIEQRLRDLGYLD